MADIFDCADPDQRSRGIISAVAALKAGRLVVLPTDTVYGIGADAFDSTVVVQAPSLRWDLGDAHGTVMLRMPLHPVAIELLREVGPMAVSSANVSGQPAAVDADEARRQLGDLVDTYLDAGPSAQQAASTILDLSGNTPRILREGPVSTERIAEVLGVDAASLIA
jgi:L-threonylcarbamoyladenylate synthase